ncbi:uncharacterized protein LOC142167380 [Nicotiana tabacum]|uniref:Uncharacterized protein LOC142167380 n=1 Tax=Nicotiana tabacum TaxID=4097 RepID=A0AC58SFB1_TOBAC
MIEENQLEFTRMGHPTHECQASTTDEVVNAVRSFDRGTLLAGTERNKKETINVVSLRSGQVFKDPIAKQKGELIEIQVEIMEEQKTNDNQEDEVRVDPDDGLKKKGRTRAQKKKKDGNSMNKRLRKANTCPLYLFPRSKEERSWTNNLVEETLVVKLTEHCSAILQNKLPQKCGDPGSFTIPFFLGSTNFEKSLCDSLADQTTIIPEGIVEDVMVRMDKFVFLMDFIVVNMEENKEVPMILGRLFLATGRAILDIQERQLILRVGKERVVFKMKKAVGAPRYMLMSYSDSKAGALKQRAGEGKHDKCGVYPKKAKKKTFSMDVYTGSGVQSGFRLDSEPD